MSRTPRSCASGERLGSTKTTASAASVELLPALALELRAHRSRQASRNLALVHRDVLVFSTSRGKPAAALAFRLSLGGGGRLARYTSMRVTATMHAGVADATRETLTRSLAAGGYGS